MIQAVMLIALGFLTAALIGVLVAPSLWSRAYRLSRKRLEQTLPVTLSEIEATQDQLRASYAVQLRRLETALAGTKQKAAMQLVDNSRLQMQIVALKDQIADLDLKLSERRNAATVLEQTITKRFPELDREITGVKAQLQERSYELQDLTNKLGRRTEELEAAQHAAASYGAEVARLQEALEKNSADRNGRRFRRASQWNLDDYRSEYDRLNLELSKLRQQLAQLQDRDTQQAGLIKAELQKLAELILVSAQPKTDEKAPARFAAGGMRAPAAGLRKDRPQPWPQSVPRPAALQTAIAGPAAAEAETSSEAVPDGDAAARPSPLSAVLSALPETVPDHSNANGSLKAAGEEGASGRAGAQEAAAGDPQAKAPLEPAVESPAVESKIPDAAKHQGSNGLMNGSAETKPETKSELNLAGAPAAKTSPAAMTAERGSAPPKSTLLDRLREAAGETAEADK